MGIFKGTHASPEVTFMFYKTALFENSIFDPKSSLLVIFAKVFLNFANRESFCA